MFKSPKRNEYPTHKAGEICFACSSSVDKGGKLVLHKPKYKDGKMWLGCSRFPECKNSVIGDLTEENNYRGKLKRKVLYSAR